MLRRLVAAAKFDLKVDVAERADVDPVIEAYKPGIDQTLLIENLRRSPERRMQNLVEMARLGAEFDRARRAAKRVR
jgi:hypothetical protein